MIKKIFISLMLCMSLTSVSADEGMWLPSLIGSRIKDMRQKGFKLSAEDIYSINKASLKDAVVLFGGGCTGEYLDGLNFLAGKRISEINKMAELGVRLAHIDGGVPQLCIEIPAIDETSIGALIYFFEKACGISGYILGVNPFNQPGVEAYKKNMFALLDKPGYEEESKAIKARL